MQLFPNPVKDVLHLTGTTQQAKLSIYNTEGKLMLQSVAANKTKDVNVQHLPAGTYYLHVEENNASGKKTVSDLKFVKQ